MNGQSVTSRIDRLLEATRSRLERVEPEGLEHLVAEGALLIDIRPEADRARDGAMPGALIVERNVLEWRLDPTSPDRIPEIEGLDAPIVVFCNEGYASSLAADSLRQLGLDRATDLVGGYRAWSRYIAERPVPAAPASEGVSRSSDTQHDPKK